MTMGLETRFRLVGIEPPILEEYSSWFTSRGQPAPPYSADGVFVLHGYGTAAASLVAGCSLYPTDGPYALAEHAATNPKVPMRLRHAAMSFLMTQLPVYGAMRKKTVFCFVGRSMATLLRRAGFTETPHLVMWHGPWGEQ